MTGSAGNPRWPTALAELANSRESTGLFFDIDGTLAPIVDRPEDASVKARIAAELDELASQYRFVACITGRRAVDAREIVGARAISYIGLHGLERLDPGDVRAGVDAEAIAGGDAIRALSDEHAERMSDAGVRVEDKHPITALHWRGAEDEEYAAGVARDVAERAVDAGADARPGRKVIEMRPDTGIDKGVAVSRLVEELGLERVLYVGDDSTDVDAFRALGQMRVDRVLKRVLRVAVASAEEPRDLRSRADVVVEGPEDVERLISALA